MTGDLWSHLSNAARIHLPSVVVNEHVMEEVPAIIDSGTGYLLDQELKTLAHSARQFNAKYSGTCLEVLGGPVQGQLRLGVTGMRPLWRTSDGIPVFRAATHDSAQCTFVISGTGAFGCSWTDEFTPLFDSVDQLFESCAAWASVQGWHYAAIVEADGQTVAEYFGVEIDRAASGVVSKWWRASDVVVSAAPFLNPKRSAFRQVIVLVPTSSGVESARRLLEAAGYSDVGAIAADIRQRVSIPSS